MPTLKPDTNPAYLLPASNPLNQSARLKRDAEVRQNCLAIAKLLLFSAAAGALLALRK